MNKWFLLISILLLSACSTNKIVEKGKIVSGGEIKYLLLEVKDEDHKKRNAIMNDKQYFLSSEERADIIKKSNREIIKMEKEKLENFLEYEKIIIPNYDVVDFKTDFEPTDFENYTFKKSELYNAVQDAKNISNQEVSYFSKHKTFILPTNTITFYAYYPCADISDKLIAGSVNIKRKFEISAGYLGGVKNIDGYQKSINNRGIRLVLE